tara:strand:+ start:141 stop:404 length:264 start_codon:yes stop_codon:yes gene_type:complete
MSYIKDVTSLSEFTKTLSDVEIAYAIAEYKNKRYSQLTSASHLLNNAILTEWESRYGKKPIPRVIPDCEMVLQQGDNSSCKFIKHLL